MKNEEIKAFLLHLGFNMWCEWLPQELMTDKTLGKRKPDYKLACDEKLWLETTSKLAATGTNMLLIDVGEALAYPSHPELAVEGSWSPDRMRAEVKRLKAMGIEAIPKHMNKVLPAGSPFKKNVHPYQIPLRACRAADLDNLWMAGRCISGDFFTQASYRITGTAVEMGYNLGKVLACR